MHNNSFLALHKIAPVKPFEHNESHCCDFHFEAACNMQLWQLSSLPAFQTSENKYLLKNCELIRMPKNFRSQF